jgi:riboflavin kinase/FMN adenylyltransferase
MSGPSVLTIGTFDGVHLGHRALVARARELARGTSAKVVALAFDPHPLSRLRPALAPARLTTFAQKREQLLLAGADEVVRLDPFDEVLELEPHEFVHRLVSRYGPIAVVEGEDFRFGTGRVGDMRVMDALGREHGFMTEALAPVEVMLGDATVAQASSTAARTLIRAGRMGDAARMLGRAFELRGTVVRGDRRGRAIGYPTANLDTELLLPADGVYAALATLPDGRRLGAALSVGTKPTFTETPARVAEAFLLDLGGGGRGPGRPSDDPRIPGLDEYGWTLSLHVVAWVREQVRFHSLQALLDQMGRDIEKIGSLLADRLGGQDLIHAGAPQAGRAGAGIGERGL